MTVATKVFVDLETSGLDAFQHGPLSLGLYEPNSGRSLYLEFRLGPDVEWTQEALDVNGFDEEDIFDEDKPLPEEALPEIVKFLGSFGGRVQLAGWNVSFDRLFLDNHVFVTSYPNVTYYWFDVASVASWQKGQTYLSMKKASALYGVKPEPDVHDALEGAKNCARIWAAINA